MIFEHLHRGFKRDNSGANDYLRDGRSLARCLVHTECGDECEGLPIKPQLSDYGCAVHAARLGRVSFFFTVFHLSRLPSPWQERTCPVLYSLAFLRSLVTGITSAPFPVFDRDGYVRRKKQCSISNGREKGRRSIDLVRCNCFEYKNFVELLRDN